MTKHFIIDQRKAPEAMWPVEHRVWAHIPQVRRKPAPRSSWPLVGLAVVIVIFAIKGLNL